MSEIRERIQAATQAIMPVAFARMRFDAARIATAMAVGSLLNTRSSCAAI